MDGTDEENEGTWVLTSGETETPYLNWGENEGGQSTDENCVGSWTTDGSHCDVACDDRRSPIDVVCEIESKSIF